jgi:hypothetical protein
MHATPDFIVAGPLKTGTSWIYEQLKRCEGFDMPPLKELFFLHEADLKYQLSTSRNEKILRQEIPYRQLTPSLIEHRRQNIKNKIQEQYKRRLHDFQNIFNQGHPLWAMYYYLIPRKINGLGMALYTRLFPKTPDKITGDVSPAYFTLSLSSIEKIKKYLPDIKILFIIREPMEREWSHIRMLYDSEGRISGFPKDEYLQYPNRESDYQLAFSNWEKYFDSRHILYLFYDELVENPDAFINKILTFLKPGAKINSLLKERVLPGTEMEIDNDLRARLIERNMPQYRFLAEKFKDSPYPQIWLKNAVQTVNAGSKA